MLIRSCKYSFAFAGEIGMVYPDVSSACLGELLFCNHELPRTLEITFPGLESKSKINVLLAVNIGC